MRAHVCMCVFVSMFAVCVCECYCVRIHVCKRSFCISYTLSLRVAAYVCGRAGVCAYVRGSVRARGNSYTIDTFRIEKAQERGLQHLNLDLDVQHHERQGCVYVCVSACVQSNKS